jgi:hypothetical protein
MAHRLKGQRLNGRLAKQLNGKSKYINELTLILFFPSRPCAIVPLRLSTLAPLRLCAVAPFFRCRLTLPTLSSPFPHIS